MFLSPEHYIILSSYIGYGIMNHPKICFFGNESGTGGMTVEDYVPKFLYERRVCSQ